MGDAIKSADAERAARCIGEMFASSPEVFNRLDARTGDGDMGSTLAALGEALRADADPFPEDLGRTFARLVAVISKTSGSSLSAVTMTILHHLSKSTAGMTGCRVGEFAAHLSEAIAAAQARSQARPGDKTVLDALEAIAGEARGAETLAQLGERAAKACEQTILAFRDRPSRIGRARLAESGGVGLDDPGMVALGHAVAAARGENLPT